MGGDAAFVGLDIAARFEALGIELERLVRFLQRQQLPACQTMLVLATPLSLPITDGSAARGSKPPNSALPAACSSSHFGVRT